MLKGTHQNQFIDDGEHFSASESNSEKSFVKFEESANVREPDLYDITRVCYVVVLKTTSLKSKAIPRCYFYFYLRLLIHRSPYPVVFRS